MIPFYLKTHVPDLEDSRFTVYEDEKEVIATNVSTCSLQMQSHKGKLSSNKVVKSLRLHMEHLHSHDKTIRGLSWTPYHSIR